MAEESVRTPETIKWESGGFIHACEGEEMVRGNHETFLVWTKCGKDVPANKGFRSAEPVTCERCLT